MVRDCSNVKSRLLPRYFSRESGSNYSRKAFTLWLIAYEGSIELYAHILDKPRGTIQTILYRIVIFAISKLQKTENRKKRVKQKQLMYGKYDNLIKKVTQG